MWVCLKNAIKSLSVVLFTWECWELPGKEFIPTGESSTCFWFTENHKEDKVIYNMLSVILIALWHCADELMPDSLKEKKGCNKMW